MDLTILNSTITMNNKKNLLKISFRPFQPKDSYAYGNFCMAL